METKRTINHKKRAEIETRIERGSGNVFADLGFAEAEELQTKAELTRQIRNRILDLKLTQAQAGGRLGISQPDISKLINGRYTGFSIDRLLALLNALSVDVEIKLRPRRLGCESRGVLRIRGIRGT